MGTPVLAFRLDRVEPFATTHELGERVHLPMSPVGALGAVAGGRPCVLVVDQLDAVSMASGRIPDTFDAVADLVDEAAAHPGMRVVLACRAFDAEADARIRRLTAPAHCAHITVGPLSDAQVDATVVGMGLDVSRLAPTQRRCCPPRCTSSSSPRSRTGRRPSCSTAPGICSTPSGTPNGRSAHGVSRPCASMTRSRPSSPP
ncbi:hypothetical protein ACRAWF_09805 [Streptomyces sp. L7]